MATQGAVETFRSSFGGGGSPYAGAYMNTAPNLGEDLEFNEATKKMKSVLDVAGFMDAEDKENLAIEKQKQKEAHEKIMDERKFRLDEWRQQKELDAKEREVKAQERQAAYYDLARKKEEAHELRRLKDEELSTRATELGSQIYALDPNRPDYGERIKSIITDPMNMKVLNSRFGKEPRMMQKEQDTAHKNMVSWLQRDAAANGYTGSVYDLPKTKEGEWDLNPSGSIYGETGAFTSARNQMMANQPPQPKPPTAQEIEERAQAAGLIPVGIDPKTGQYKYGTKKGGDNLDELLGGGKKQEEQEAPENGPKQLTSAIAMDYLQKAGGDREKAREMARKDGYTF